MKFQNVLSSSLYFLLFLRQIEMQIDKLELLVQCQNSNLHCILVLFSVLRVLIRHLLNNNQINDRTLCYKQCFKCVASSLLEKLFSSFSQNLRSTSCVKSFPQFPLFSNINLQNLIVLIIKTIVCYS